MRRLWGERQLYFLLSVAIAVAMWYVATAENPVSRSVKVDLETRNLYPTEIIVRPSPTATVKVTVRVQGPRSQIALLDPKLVEAYVDLSGLGPGEHPQVPVVVGVPVRDVQVVEQRPSSIFVVLDTFASKRPHHCSLVGPILIGVQKADGDGLDAHLSLDEGRGRLQGQPKAAGAVVGSARGGVAGDPAYPG